MEISERLLSGVTHKNSSSAPREVILLYCSSLVSLRRLLLSHCVLDRQLNSALTVCLWI